MEEFLQSTLREAKGYKWTNDVYHKIFSNRVKQTVEGTARRNLAVRVLSHIKLCMHRGKKKRSEGSSLKGLVSHRKMP